MSELVSQATETDIQRSSPKTLFQSVHVGCLAATSTLLTYWLVPPHVAFGWHVFLSAGIGLLCGSLGYLALRRYPDRALNWYVLAVFLPIFWATFQVATLREFGSVMTFCLVLFVFWRVSQRQMKKP